MAINTLVEQMCEEGIGLIDVCGYLVGKEDMYMRDGLHLSGNGQQCSLRTGFDLLTMEQFATI